jgi:hypothetical protein
MPSTDRECRARVPSHLACKHPGLPRDWVLVLERNEETMRPEPLPGYVWLESAPPAEEVVSCVGRPPGVPQTIRRTRRGEFGSIMSVAPVTASRFVGFLLSPNLNRHVSWDGRQV